MQATREGTFRLVKSINAVRENPQVNDQKLEALFKGWWRDFEDTLKTLPAPLEKQASPRSERDFLEVILQKVDILVQAQQTSTRSRLTLPNEELAHLLNLRHQPAMTYRLHSNLQKELQHLRDLRLIKNKQGSMPITEELSAKPEFRIVGIGPGARSALRRPD